jgi:anti-sigma factor RsiW
MSCEFAHDDAAYVLGALSPAERLAFERHLPGCAECSHAVQELAGLPGLLGRVSRETLETEPTTVPVPETLLPRLMREARHAQRRRTWVTAGLAVAATVIVSAGVVVLTGVPGGGEPAAAPPTPSVSASPSPSAAPAQAMVPVTETPMAVDVSMTGVAWGTRLALVCSYASTDESGQGGAWGDGEDAEPTYALVVRDREGQVEQVATWRALPGKTMHLDAATATSREDIASVEVRTADGQPVLQLDG